MRFKPSAGVSRIALVAALAVAPKAPAAPAPAGHPLRAPLVAA